MSVPWLVLRLEWTVFSRWLRETVEANAILLLGIALVLWQTTVAAAWIGREAATAAIPHIAAEKVFLVACSLTWLAMIGFAWGSRQIQFVDDVSRSLRIGRHSSWHRFVSILSLDIGGRQVCAIALCIPVGTLAVTALSTPRAVILVLGLLVLVAMSPAVARLLGRVLGLDSRIVLVIGGLIAGAIAKLPAAGIALAGQVLPAGLVVQAALGESPEVRQLAWAILGLYAGVILCVDWLIREHRPDPQTSAGRSGRLSLRGFSLRSLRLQLLWRELLSTFRTRRIANMWLLVTGFVLLVAVTRPPSQDLNHRLVFFLIGPIMLAFPFTNIFGVDGLGAQAYWLQGVNLRNVIMAKHCAAAIPPLGVLIAGQGALWVRGNTAPLGVDVFCGVAALGIVVWHSAAGLLTSVAFPRASDPQRTMGTFAPSQTALTIAVCDAIFIGAAVLLAHAFGGPGRDGWVALSGLVLLSAALLGRAAAQRLALLVLQQHRQRILHALVRSARDADRASFHAV